LTETNLLQHFLNSEFPDFSQAPGAETLVAFWLSWFLQYFRSTLSGAVGGNAHVANARNAGKLCKECRRKHRKKTLAQQKPRQLHHNPHCTR